MLNPTPRLYNLDSYITEGTRSKSAQLRKYLRDCGLGLIQTGQLQLPFHLPRLLRFPNASANSTKE
jgi:hypothetical protein